MAQNFTPPDPLRFGVKTLSIYITELQDCVNTRRAEIAQTPITIFVNQRPGNPIRLSAIEQLKTLVVQLALDFGYPLGIEDPTLLGRPYVEHPKDNRGESIAGFPIINDLRQILGNLVVQVNNPIFVSSNWFDILPAIHNETAFGNWTTQKLEPRDKTPIAFTVSALVTSPVITPEDLAINNFTSRDGQLKGVTDKTIIVRTKSGFDREAPIVTSFGELNMPFNVFSSRSLRQTDESFQYFGAGNEGGNISLNKTARDGSTGDILTVLVSSPSNLVLRAISKTKLCYVGNRNSPNQIIQAVGLMNKLDTSLSVNTFDGYLNLGLLGARGAPGVTVCVGNIRDDTIVSDGTKFFAMYQEVASKSVFTGPGPFEHDNTIIMTEAIVDISSGIPSVETILQQDTFNFHSTSGAQACNDASIQFRTANAQFAFGGIRGDGGFWWTIRDQGRIKTTLQSFPDDNVGLYFDGTLIHNIGIVSGGPSVITFTSTPDSDWKGHDITSNNVDCLANWQSKSVTGLLPKPKAEDLIIKTIDRVIEIPVNVPTINQDGTPFTGAPTVAIDHVKITLDHLPNTFRYRIETRKASGGGFSSSSWNNYESKDIVDLSNVLGNTSDSLEGYFVRIKGISPVDGAIFGPEVSIGPIVPDESPLLLTLTPAIDSIDVTFNAPVSPDPVITFFEWRIRQTAPTLEAWSSWTSIGLSTAFTASGLITGNTYKIEVASSNTQGRGVSVSDTAIPL